MVEVHSESKTDIRGLNNKIKAIIAVPHPGTNANADANLGATNANDVKNFPTCGKTLTTTAPNLSTCLVMNINDLGTFTPRPAPPIKPRSVINPLAPAINLAPASTPAKVIAI